MIKPKYNKKKHFTFITLILSLALIYTKSNNSKSIPIQGKAIIKIGNNMPSLGTNNFNANIKSKKIKIIALPGRVRNSGQRFIAIEKIPHNAIIKETNSRGEFKMRLVPGKYTFFILKENEAYRNSFDGKGFFTHTQIDKNAEDLLLIYDKFALY